MKAFEPSIKKVPLLMPRKPAVFAPSTVNVPIPGVNSRVEALEVPLLRVTPVTAFRLVLPLPVQLVLLAPVKVMATCEVFAF